MIDQIKQQYAIVEFDTLQAYQQYIIKCVADSSISKIVYCGASKFIDLHAIYLIIKRLKVPYSYDELILYPESLKEWVVIQNRTKVKKNHNDK